MITRTPDQTKFLYILSGILIILYLVGIFGFAADWDYLIKLTPIQLLISAVCLILAHFQNRNKVLLFGLLAYLGSFLIECLGVNSGFPFGEYQYHEVLGPKLYHTPLIIGINWFILLMASRSITEKMIKRKNIFMQVVLSSALMVGLDFLIEPVAVYYHFWTWSGDIIPWNNYVAWFLIAAMLQFLSGKMIDRYSNICADVLFFLQVLFFGTLNLILLFI